MQLIANERSLLVGRVISVRTRSIGRFAVIILSAVPITVGVAYLLAYHPWLLPIATAGTGFVAIAFSVDRRIPLWRKTEKVKKREGDSTLANGQSAAVTDHDQRRMGLATRWGVAVAASAAGFALSWWGCLKLLHLDDSAALGIAGAVLAALVAVAGCWAAPGAYSREAGDTERIVQRSFGNRAAYTHQTLDEAAIEHSAKMRKLRWALEEEEAKQKLRRIKSKNEQEILAENVAVYREIIASGDVERFALRLASHPYGISAITEIIQEDQSRSDAIDFIKHMVDSGVVERWEVSDQVREALEWLRDATAHVVTDRHYRTEEVEEPLQQRRHGRGDPIEEDTKSEPPKEIVVPPAEDVSEQKADSGE